MTTHANTAPHTKYLTVFNGVVGLSLIFSIWCTTYFFSWFGVYDNPQDITKMRGEVMFSLIPAGFLIAPLLFYSMAFVNTFSLTHNKPEGEYLTIFESLWFILKKILKLTPFNLVVLWWGMGMVPGMGSGPYWDLYPESIKGCTDGNWIWNLLFL